MGNRRSDADARRAELIDATARVLGRLGGPGVSVRAIAAEAGVSPGLIAHHFDGVDALIADTFAHVSARVSAALDAAIMAAGPDPFQRLEAFTRASFDPPIADPALLATWIALWSLVGRSPAVAAAHDRSYRGYRETLETLLAECGLPAGERRLAAISVAALVDGLWLELCLAPGNFTADEARRIARQHLAALLPSQRDRSANSDR